MSRRKLAARGQLFAAALFFGLMAALVRLGSCDAPGFPSAQMSAVRFTVGIGMTPGLFWLRPGTFRPVRYRLLFTHGALGGVAVLLDLVSLARVVLEPPVDPA